MGVGCLSHGQWVLDPDLMIIDSDGLPLKQCAATSRVRVAAKQELKLTEPCHEKTYPFSETVHAGLCQLWSETLI